jgi:hypothetical protein
MLGTVRFRGRESVSGHEENTNMLKQLAMTAIIALAVVAVVNRVPAVRHIVIGA